MKVAITKSSLYQILLILCVTIPNFREYEIVFGIWIIAIFFTLRKTYGRAVIKYMLPFIVILILATIVGILHDYKIYSMIRDFTYLLKPILGLLLGYQLFRNSETNHFNKLIYAGVVLSIGHLLTIAIGILFFGIRSMIDLRYFAGYFSDYEVCILILLLFHKKFEINIPKKRLYLFILIVGMSSFLYLARTHFILFGLLILALKGYFIFSKKNIIIMSSFILFFSISFAVLSAFNPRRDAKGIEALLYKIKNSPNEAFKTKVDIHDWKDLNDNYRSHENIVTIRQVSNDGIGAVLFGKGIGSTVDLKTEIWLQSSLMRYIPILHSSFMTVFLKTGLLGILFLFVSMRVFFVNKKSKKPMIRNINFILVGMGVYLIVSNWVSLGLYFATDSKSIFIGFLLAYRLYLEKNQNEPEIVSE